MKKRTKIILIGTLMCICLLICGSLAVSSEPGGVDDPVITKSYIVDVVIPEIKAYIDERFGIAASEGTATTHSNTFTVVNVPAGKTVICDAGAELILRMGKGTIVATPKGGLADTTAGYDLANGAQMPANHLLVVPLNDGRGFRAENDVIVMIKGGYNIK